MNELNSTITSKGQITLPKTVRDVMNLSTGDHITFTIESDKQAIMEKAEFSIKNQSKMNLISLLMNNGLPIIIKGRSRSGKNLLSKSFLVNQCADKKVAVIEPISEHKELENYIDITCFETEYLEPKTASKVQYGDYELVVINEAGNYNFDLIAPIHLSGKKLILISQVFDPNDLLKLRSHYSITLDTGGMVIEHYELNYDTFNVKTIYVD
ncbi:AbrB/MazE/SpoVT family DNA-binding domain-containing protein [Oceanobacillus timonensis]|uniref:AbrB/MazE/SpoVT family DNA-binding domain-containing protein n=1 Tax=Oceanobacillus timonensis TaxID=1926285 RepID=UPI0015C44774|nr:type II toxin-antitoxin system PrlF family antitoxin [Oceanobacillus timonensis]